MKTKQFETFYDIERDNNIIDLTITYEGTLSNDGIGEYEYWGQRCFDEGEDFVEFERIISVVDENGKDWINELTTTEEEQIEIICKDDCLERLEDFEEY